MALVKRPSTLGSPSIDTNLGREVQKQREQQQSTRDFNNALVDSGTKFDPRTQTANTSGYEAALQKYNSWIASGKAKAISDATSIALNKNTGDIMVSAPQKVLDSPLVKENYEPALKTLSESYKRDSSYKFALMANSDEMKTAEEWVSDLNESLKKEAPRYYEREETKDEIESSAGVRLNDKQLTKRSTVAVEYDDGNGNTVLVKDDTMQAIPASAMSLDVFKNLKGWDEEEHVVSWGELKKVWDRDKVSDEAILDLYKFVDEYFAKGDFSNPDELAEMMALNTFITRKDPSVNFWRGAAEVLGETIGGIITGAATFDAGVLSSFETIGNWFANMLESTSMRISGVDADTAWKEATSNDANFIRDYLAPTLQETISEHHENISKLNDIAGGFNTITNTLVPIGMQIAVANAAGRAGADMMETSVGRIITASAAKTGANLSSLSTVLMSNIASGAITAKEVVTSLYFGTDIMLKLSTPAAATSAVINAINMLRTASLAAKAVVKTADIAAQAIVDITLSDPKLFRQLMESDDVDAKAYALEQLAQNAGAEIASVGIARGVKAFASTDLGTVLNAKWATRIGGLKASMGEAVDKMKIALFHGGDADWLVKQRDLLSKQADELAGTWLERMASNRASAAERRLRNYGARLVERQAAKNVAELAGDVKGATWDEIVESAKKVQKEARNIYSTANMTIINAIYQRDVSAEVAKIIADNPKLKAARDGFLDTLTTLLKAEDAAGLGKGARVIELTKGQKFRLLSKETNEYVNALYRAREAEATVKLSEVAEDVNGAKKELEHWTEVIKNFEESQPVEVVEAAKKLELAGRKFEFQIQNVKVAMGVLPQEVLDAMRFSGRFDKGYLRQQRIKDWSNYKKRGGQLHISELRGVQNYKWGSFDEWQDISLVVFDDLEQTARQVVRKRAIDGLKGLGFDVTAKVTADGVRMVDEVNPTRAKAMSTINRNADTFVKDMDDSVLNDIFSFRKRNTVIARAIGADMKQTARLGRTQKLLPNVRQKEVIRFLSDTPGDTIDDLIRLDAGNPFTIDIEAEGGFDAFRAALGEKADKWLQQRMDAQVGYLYEKPISDYERGTRALATSEKYNAKQWRRVTGQKVPDWAKSMVSNKGTKTLSDLSEVDELHRAWDALKTSNRVAPTLYTAENFKRLVANDPDVINELKRAYATMNKKIYGSEAAIRAAQVHKQQKEIFEQGTLFLENRKAFQELYDKYGFSLPELEARINDEIDELIEVAIDNNAADPAVVKALNALGDASAGGDDILEYATLKSLTRHKRKIKNQFFANAKGEFNKMITADINTKYAITDSMTAAEKKAVSAAKKKALQSVEKISNDYANAATEWFEERLMQRYNEVTGRLAAQGSDIIDKKDYFAKVDALNQEITKAASNPNVVKTYGAGGYEEYVELSPTIANMFTSVPRPLRVGPFGQLQRVFTRAFRFGTTGGFVPGSLINQAFRDTGNALVAGDAWKDSKAVEKMLADNFGDTIAEYMQREMPDVWETLLAKSEETGTPVNTLLARRELQRGALNVESELETNIYQFGREAKIKRSAEGLYDPSKFDRITDAVDNFQRKADTLNNIRETSLRNRVYNNNLLKGLQDGMSLEEARNFAAFMQAEATTNFSRQSYHLANLTQTVPYLGAAINGSKSFWRLFTLDPVGISTRVVGGYVVPVIALTVMSLSDPENARIYKQIPEYEKKNGLVFVVNGQIFSIPVPQEISNFVVPVQHMVETMNGANDNSFTELMANDLLGAFPIDLSGFVGVDTDRILEEDLFHQHLIPGFVKASSQLMAPLVKSGFMMVTGIDPYTMKHIDTSYINIDPETGEQVVMDYNTGMLAKWLGSLMGDFMSAQMAQKVLTNLVGNGLMTYIDAVGDIVSAVGDEDVSLFDGVGEALQRITENGTGRLYVERYGEESNMAWNRAVSQLYREKAQLLTDKEYQKDLSSLSDKTLSDAARKNVESRVRTRQQEYMKRVLDAANNLVNRYGGTLDRYKFGAVISLMNLELDSVNENPYNAYATYLNRQEYNINKAVAVETMMKMGFPSMNDESIFGYYYEDDDGNVTIKYNSPLEILNYNQSSWRQNDIAIAEIRQIIQDSGIDTSKMYGTEFDAAKAKGKAALKQYKADWNSKIVKVLAPYVQMRGVEGLLNSAAVRDFLDNYIFVDNPYKTKDYLLKVFGDK